MNKTIKLTLCALFMGLSCAVYAENDVVTYDANEQLDDIVFTFMRKSQILPELFELTSREKGISFNGERKVIMELPFRKLYRQLNAKAEKLAEAEGKLARESGKINLEEMEKTMKEVEASENLLTMIEKTRTALKGYPAMIEMSELMFAKVYDVKEILEGILETDIDSFNKDLDEVIARLASTMSKSELDELFGLIFDDEMEQYKTFVEENKAVLEKVSALANNGFEITVATPKKCKTIKGKQFCTSGQAEKRGIKTISEIMPYINSMQPAEAIDAPHSDL